MNVLSKSVRRSRAKITLEENEQLLREKLASMTEEERMNYYIQEKEKSKKAKHCLSHLAIAAAIIKLNGGKY